MITEEQKEQRRSGLGGSDAAPVCGVSKFSTPWHVYQAKVNDVEKDVTQAMREGAALEETILQYYVKQTGVAIEHNLPTFFNKKYEFMLANIDGLAGDTIVEAKTANSKNGWGLAGTCEVPIDYLFQVAHYCAVLDKPRADIIVRFSFGKYEIYTYNRNEILEKSIIKKEEEFWNKHVIARVEPEITSIKDAKIKYKESENRIAIADGYTKNKFNQLIATTKKRKELEEIEEALKLDLMLRMGVSNELRDENGKKLVSWKEVQSNRLDQQRLKIEKPGIYNEYFIKNVAKKFTTNYHYN